MAKHRHFSALIVSLVALAALVTPSPAVAAVLLRDVETERTIRAYSTPIFEAAGLAPQAVDIYLIDDRTLNAFVAGGQNIFLNTGLLLGAKSYTEVLGVVAHETGHIIGGHLSRTRAAMEDASTLGLLSTVIGIGAGLLAGSGELAAAAATAGQQVTTRNFLSYSRAQESAADQAALRLLEANGTSARGLADFLGVLEDQELVGEKFQEPYVRTHPISRERIDAIQAHMERSKYADTPPDPVFEAAHRRIRAKVFAYSNPLQIVLNEYPESDQSLPARYARTFAYYRKPNFEKAIDGIDALIGEYPDDPYFHELKGQILFERGDANGAVASYRRASEILPREPLLRVLLAQALIATDNPDLLPEAEENLEVSLITEPDSAFAWRQLAIAYGRQDKLGESALALGEEALLRRRYDDAIFNARRAESLFPEGSQQRIQAQDILTAAENRKAK